MENSDAEGYIYILINASLQQDMLKIGMTSRQPEERASELSSGTGMPTDYSVAYAEYVTDRILAEKLIHQKLHKYRVSRKREFFRLPIKLAIQVVSQVAEQVKDNYELEGDESEYQITIESAKSYDKDFPNTRDIHQIFIVLSVISLVLGLILLFTEIFSGIDVNNRLTYCCVLPLILFSLVFFAASYFVRQNAESSS
jgi:hypothetical protein